MELHNSIILEKFLFVLFPRYGYIDSTTYYLLIFIIYVLLTGLELARVPRVPGTRQNSEHHLWHLQILNFLILTGTRRAHSM